MRPPWFEAIPALAAAGLIFPASQLANRNPFKWKPIMSADIRFAILVRPERADVKPRAFAELRHLARHIHMQRKGATIELINAPLEFTDGQRDGVSVWTVEDGAQRCYLGWAWLNGAGRETLEAALAAITPPVVRQARAS